MLADPPPAGILDDAGVELVLPEHRDLLALRVVVDAGGTHKGRLAELPRLFDTLDEPPALTEMDELSGLRWQRRHAHYIPSHPFSDQGRTQPTIARSSAKRSTRRRKNCEASARSFVHRSRVMGSAICLCRHNDCARSTRSHSNGMAAPTWGRMKRSSRRNSSRGDCLRALHASHEDESREHEAAIERPQAEHRRLQSRLDAMYIDKLDGRVDPTFDDRMSAPGERSRPAASVRSSGIRPRTCPEWMRGSGYSNLRGTRSASSKARNPRKAATPEFPGFELLMEEWRADGHSEPTF